MQRSTCDQESGEVMMDGQQSRQRTEQEIEAARKHAEAIGFDDVYVTSDGQVFGISISSDRIRGEETYYGSWACLFCERKGSSSRACDTPDEARRAARGNASHRCYPDESDPGE